MTPLTPDQVVALKTLKENGTTRKASSALRALERKGLVYKAVEFYRLTELGQQVVCAEAFDRARERQANRERVEIDTTPSVAPAEPFLVMTLVGGDAPVNRTELHAKQRLLEARLGYLHEASDDFLLELQAGLHRWADDISNELAHRADEALRKQMEQRRQEDEEAAEDAAQAEA